MDGLTGGQWLSIIVADGAALAGAALAAGWLIRKQHPGFGVVVGLALAVLPLLGLLFLSDALRHPEEDCGIWSCWTPYELHWMGWTIAGLLVAPVSVVTVLVAGLRGWRLWRRRGPA